MKEAIFTRAHTVGFICSKVINKLSNLIRQNKHGYSKNYRTQEKEHHVEK